VLAQQIGVGSPVVDPPPLVLDVPPISEVLGRLVSEPLPAVVVRSVVEPLPLASPVLEVEPEDSPSDSLSRVPVLPSTPVDVSLSAPVVRRSVLEVVEVPVWPSVGEQARRSSNGRSVTVRGMVW